MTLFRTRILYSLFILLFFCLSALILFYGRGFTYNQKKGTVEQLGGIYLEFTPTDAQITIDGKPQKQQHPFVASHLTPGTHTIRITRERFRTWQKTLTIPAGTSVNLAHIILFPETAPEHLAESPDPIPAQRTDTTPTLFTTSTESQSIRITFKDRITSLPFSQKMIITESSPYQTLFVHDTSNRILSLVSPIDQGTPKLETQIFPGIDGWVQRDALLLLYGDIDLWLVSLTDSIRELLVRRSDGIQTAAFVDEEYIAYASAGNIYITEQKNEFTRDSVHIHSFASVGKLFATKDTLYIFAKEKADAPQQSWYAYIFRTD